MKLNFHGYTLRIIQIIASRLVGFCDASERAYAAVLYLRSIAPSGEVEVSLICSKSRVAPTKGLTIPRLELLGTDLLAKLCDRVGKTLQIPISNVHRFCDSTIALTWL